MDWFRSWHGAPTDNKWISIGKRAGIAPVIVSAVVWALFDYASQNEDRGSVAGFDVETYSDFAGVEQEKIGAILKALQDKGLIENNRFVAWDRRQYSENNSEMRKLRSCYVYFIGTSLNDAVKIGISKNPWARLKDLQTGSSKEYSVLAVVKTTSPSEADLHQKFAKSRKSGEWFLPSKALISLITKINQKEIETQEECLPFLSSIHIDDFEVIPTNELRSNYSATKEKIQSRAEKKVVSKETTKRLRAVPEKPDDVSGGVWDDFLDLRKRKRSPITATALEGIRQEADKAGWVLQRALAECCSRGWQGFKAEWVAPQGQAPPSNGTWNGNQQNGRSNATKLSKSDRARAALFADLGPESGGPQPAS